jgi:tRNA U34 5-methylaminomethyl-2-thiouridine-forming methyltransferase MnmC
MDRRLVLTRDGSHTLLVPGLGEHYHSIYGAVTESLHVFIENGFRQTRGGVSILEAGFGTGLNAFLTFREARQSNRKVFYESWEKHPLVPDEFLKLNYPDILAETERSIFRDLHETPWNIPFTLTNFFTLHKVAGDLLEFHSDNRFDLVYFDAFGPDFQPDLWECEVFRAIYRAMAPEALLVTYSAKGQVKRNLVQAGFIVRKLPGPPGKREMIAAVKST